MIVLCSDGTMTAIRGSSEIRELARAGRVVQLVERGQFCQAAAHTPILVTRAGVVRGLEFDERGEPVVRFGRDDYAATRMIVRTFAPFEVRDRDASGWWVTHWILVEDGYRADTYGDPAERFLRLKQEGCQ